MNNKIDLVPENLGKLLSVILKRMFDLGWERRTGVDIYHLFHDQAIEDLLPDINPPSTVDQIKEFINQEEQKLQKQSYEKQRKIMDNFNDTKPNDIVTSVSSVQVQPVVMANMIKQITTGVGEITKYNGRITELDLHDDPIYKVLKELFKDLKPGTYREIRFANDEVAGKVRQYIKRVVIDLGWEKNSKGALTYRTHWKGTTLKIMRTVENGK